MNKLIITNAGLAEIVNAEKSGTAPVVLSHVAFGTGQYTATADMTALKSEFKRMDSVAGGAVADNLIHLTVHDNSTDKYTVNEIGIFTASGTLFAVYSQTTPIMEKSATSETMIAIDIVLTDIDPASITVGDTSFVLNPATTDAAGIVELATEAEATAGTDKTRAMTPAAAKAARDADANIVHRTGNETIAGSKTFTSNPAVKAVDPQFRFIQNDIVKGTKPETDQHSAVLFRDNADAAMGCIQNIYASDGSVHTRLGAYQPVAGSTSSVFLDMVYPASGDPYATAPTPAAGDNSTKIATTAWVNTKVANFLPLAGGTMSGNISFADGQVIAPTASAAYRGIGLYADNGVWEGNGAGLALRSKNAENNAAGIFQLRAGNGTDTAVLLGKPDGALTWQNKNIVRSVNSKNADAAGNVAITSVESATKATQDGNGKVIASTYLPLAGGTMSGVIKFSSGYICRADTTGSFQVSGGTGVYGATLQLFGHNHDTLSGQFYIKANDGTNESGLRGHPDGKLMWQNKDIVRSVNGKTADDAGNAAITATDVDALPTSGGAMTADKAIYRNVNTGHLALYGGTGTGNDGAQLDLCGSAHSTMPGTFQLHARNGATDVILRGETDGKLLWDGKYVLTNSYSGPTSASTIILNAGTYDVPGAGLRLYGAHNSSTPGRFIIKADNGTQNMSLRGDPDGTLLWGGNPIVILVEKQNPTADNGYTWYRKYSDGWVEQGGLTAQQSVSSGSSKTQALTFPILMSDTNYVITFGSINGAYSNAILTERSTTGGTLLQSNRAGSGSADIQHTWYVCGYAAD